MEISTRALSAEDWEVAADVAARSLQSSFVGMLGEDPVERLAFFYERYRGLPNDHAVVVGAFAGPFLMGMARAVAPDFCVCVLPPEVPEGASEGLRKGIEAHHAFTRERHAGEPHWWVGPVGVEPGMQGRGIGSAAMRELDDQLKDREAMIRLEAEDINVGFYERLGYKRLERAVAPDGIALTFMSTP